MEVSLKLFPIVVKLNVSLFTWSNPLDPETTGGDAFDFDLRLWLWFAATTVMST
jgi:hypothetical protein